MQRGISTHAQSNSRGVVEHLSVDRVDHEKIKPLRLALRATAEESADSRVVGNPSLTGLCQGCPLSASYPQKPPFEARTLSQRDTISGKTIS